MPTLRQFQYLVAVADIGHFGRAASSLNVSQPTLSHQLKALEQRLGTVLVERGLTPVQLSPIGRELAGRARKLLLDVDEIKALARRAEDKLAGTIRFGVTPTLGPYLMPNIIADLHRKHPEMHMYVREGIPDMQLAEVRRGALDMIVTPLTINAPDVHAEPLFQENLYLVAQPDHPLFAQDKITRNDLAGYGILSLDPRHHFHRQAEKLCHELGAELLRDYEGTSLDSLRQMAGSGLGIAILPELYIRSEVRRDNVVRQVHVQNWTARRSISAIWRKGAAYENSFMNIAEAIRSEAARLTKAPT